MRKMKDSGIEWIGEIPHKWTLSKIGAIYQERNIKVSDSEYAPLSVTKHGIVPQLETAAKTDNGDNRKLIRKNDFVINSRSDRKGSCGISEYDGSCSLINTVLQPKRNMCNKYYNYVFHSDLFSDEFYRWGNGIVDDLWSTKWSAMKRIYIPAPNLEEQCRIADYLDSKCSKIDEYIDKQQQLIEKLKEYKQSVITEAVTKGLDPTVPMKDSNNIWYDTVPAHWGMKKVKYLFKIQKRIAGKEGHSILSITQRGIVPKDFSKNGGQFAANYSNYQLLYKGDFAMNHMDLLTGWVDISKYDGVTSPDYRVFGLEDRANCYDKYYLYFVQMCYFNKIFFGLGQGVSNLGRWRLQSNKFLNFSILVPNFDEQKRIAEYLDKKCLSIDNAIAKKQAVIDKLLEYKKSLIYEVVTGKKDVSTPYNESVTVLSPSVINRLGKDYLEELLICKIIDYLENDLKGRVHLQKILFILEMYIGFAFGNIYKRYEHGPLDENIYSYEKSLKKREWVNCVKKGSCDYKKDHKFSEYIIDYTECFSECNGKIERILDFFRGMRTSKAEKVATLFAVWNDFIIDGISEPTDFQIIEEVTTNWTKNKAETKKDTWQSMLDEMKKENLIPWGFGNHTVKKGEA